ncbi:MAG: phage holin [Bifidobacterium mongoliense]|nr:phage holin [Bifidobacterium mongoliense]
MTDETTNTTEGPQGLLPDHVYDVLKWVAIIVMPALATFIVGLGGIWSIPYAGQAASTVTAVGVLLGALLGLSSVKYHGQ